MPRGLALSWRGSTGRLDAFSTAPLPLRLPAQRGAQLCGALRIRARRALALAQLKPGVEAAARGERHAQTQRLARSAARLHPDVGRPARPALPPVKPVPHLKLVGLRRVDRRVSHQRRGVLAAPQRLDAAVGRALARPEPHRQPAPVRGRGDGHRPAEPPFLVRGVLMGQQPARVDRHRQPPGGVAEPAADRGGPRNSDSLLRWDPDQGEGVWNATEATELSC